MTWVAAACLLPSAAWGIVLYGGAAARVLAAAVLAAAAGEAAAAGLARRPISMLADGSALVTGLLVGMLMPAGVPLGVPVVASLFAVLVVKATFGGLGRNWMNPAAGGVLFALLSWGGLMARWVPALWNDQAVPPWEAWRQLAAAGGAAAGSPLAALGASGYAWSGVDAAVVGWVNAHVLGLVGLALPRGWFDLFAGIVPGAVGAVSAPLLIAGGAALVARRIVRWEVPAGFLATFAVLVLAAGGFRGGIYFHLFSGSVLLAAFFIAPDPVTSPLTRAGRWVYGAVAGALAFALRFYGGLGDGAVVAVALANAIVPVVDGVVLRGRRAGAATEGRA